MPALPHQCVRVLETVGLPFECRGLPHQRQRRLSSPKPCNVASNTASESAPPLLCRHPSRAMLPPTPPVNLVPLCSGACGTESCQHSVPFHHERLSPKLIWIPKYKKRPQRYRSNANFSRLLGAFPPAPPPPPPPTPGMVPAPHQLSGWPLDPYLIIYWNPPPPVFLTLSKQPVNNISVDRWFEHFTALLGKDIVTKMEMII